MDKLRAAFGDSPDFQPLLGLIYSDILEFHQRAYRMFRRKGWQIWFAIDWGLFEGRFKSILRRLDSHRELLDKEAAATHFLEMKRMREKRQLKEESIEQQRNNQLAREILAWLSADEDGQEEYLHRLSDQRQLGTCDWILNEPRVSAWIEDDSKDPILWMTGIPGAGKSFLCSLLVQSLEIQQDRSTLYFFCGQKPFNKDAPTLLLCTLTVQLLRQNIELAPLIHQAFLQKYSGRSPPTIRRMLKEILSTAEAVRIVLDGIDEWDQTAQREILKTIGDLQRHSGSSCRVLVSSRKEPPIDKAISHKVHMHIDTQSTDGLNRYIDSNTKDLQHRFGEMKVEIWERLQSNLRSKAHGMFLWVRLVKTMLEQCSSENEFEKQMEQLPDGLDEAYGLILSRLTALTPLLRERALRILFWVCVGYRSVEIDEVVDGIALKPDQTDLNAKNRSQNPERDILELCAPMLEKNKNGTLEMVHFSAKEYLLHTYSGPFINIANAHLDIASSCIINLTSALTLVPCLGQSVTEAEIEELVVTGSYGLHSYAHRYWMEHLIAYFGCVHEPDAQIIGALSGFSKALKGNLPHLIESFAPPERRFDPQEQRQLLKFPALARLVSVWSRFKAGLADRVSTFATLEDQETYSVQNDQTYLTLVDQRLREISERILKMDRSALPAHIRENDYNTFIARFGFGCRIHGCFHSFTSAQKRDEHEFTHVTSFPCLQCDFSGGGFRSKEALSRHVQRYHMSPKDFEITESLNSCLDTSVPSSISRQGSSSTRARFSRSWNEQGRKASQETFRKILATVESKVSASTSNMSQQALDDTKHNAAPPFPLTSADSVIVPSFDTIKNSISAQEYDTLHDFKGDLQALLTNPSGFSKVHSEVDQICDDELEKITSAFPEFAKVGSTSFKPQGNSGFPEEDFEETRVSSGVPPSRTDSGDDLEASRFGKRKTYWSTAEEKEMPELLRRYGRNLIKIAECLKTKTLAEIDLHLQDFLESERAPSLSPTEAIEANEETELSSSQTAEARFVPSDTAMDASSQYPFRLLPTSVTWSPNPPPQSTAGLANATTVRSEDISGVKRTHQIDVHDGGEQVVIRPKKTVRRRPERFKCPYCDEDFYDEYVAKKHIDRIHIATRKMWICLDQSTNATFLAGCKACSSDRLYTSRHNAMKHLRQRHFADTTTEQTLQRWMDQVEESNPKYQGPDKRPPKANSEASASQGEDSSNTGRSGKRRRIDQVAPIHRFPEMEDDPNRLPAIQSSPDLPKIFSRHGTLGQGRAAEWPEEENNSEDSRYPDSSPPKDVDLLPDVSFDNLLPSASPESTIRDEENLGSLSSSFIRPGHVHRLPHLDTYQRKLCLDQVEAHYWSLSNHARSSQRYKHAEEELRSLSRSLLKGLRDWRERSNLGPRLAYSV